MIRKLSPKDCIAIDRAVQAFVQEFTVKHAAMIERSPAMPAIVKRHLVQRIRAHFAVKRGPKPDPQILRAHELRSRGVSKRETLYRVIPGFKQLDSYGQHLVRKTFYPKLKRYEASVQDGRKKPLETRMSK